MTVYVNLRTVCFFGQKVIKSYYYYNLVHSESYIFVGACEETDEVLRVLRDSLSEIETRVSQIPEQLLELPGP